MAGSLVRRGAVAAVALALTVMLWIKLGTNDVCIDDVIGGVPVAPRLARHKERWSKPQLIQVTKQVYVAVGYGIANTIIVEGETGLIIVDTTESLRAAEEIFREVRKITDKPVEAIVYTHNHGDHVQGTESFIESAANPPDIWAFHSLVDLNHKTRVVAQRSARGAIHQFGVRLGSHLVDVGIGPYLRTNVTNAHLPPQPNRIIHQERQSTVIAGLQVTFIHVPGETADQLAVWFPDLRVLLPADDIYEAFPNLYAIRGTPPRSALEWMDSISQMRSLRAEYLVPSHTLPVTGEKAIYELMTVYLHAIQYVHDQTIRHINQGMHPEEIAKRIRLPSTLASHPYLEESYGKTTWSSKSVYESYVGWFSGDPTEIFPLAPTERAEKMLNLVGRRRLLEEASDALDQGTAEDLQWGLEMSSLVHSLDKSDQQAAEVRLRALRALAAAENNPLARNYYLTAALDDHQLIQWSVKRDEVLMRSDMWRIFDLMKGRLKAELVTDVDLTLYFVFTDIGEAFRLKIEHSVLDVDQVSPGDQMNDADVKVTTTSMVWRKILTRELSPIRAYLFSGELSIQGNVLTMRRFISYFDAEY